MSGRQTRSLFRRDSAEVGVGTLIVFIAMVLVAAVAAAVIISTSGTLQERAMTTGKEATNEVSSNMKLVGLYGERNTTSDDIYELKFFFELSAGSSDVPLEELVVRYADGTNTRIYSYGASPTFTLEWIRGTGSNNVFRSGDLLELTLTGEESEIPPRQEFEMMFIPETGAPISVNVKMPPTFNDELTVNLR